MYYPSISEFRRLSRRGNIVPVYRDIIGDMDTPVALFRRLSRKGEPGYLLESVEGGEHLGRYSFIGIDPCSIFSEKDAGHNPLEKLRNIMAGWRPVSVKGMPRFSGGAVGYVSYNAIKYIEDIPQKNPDDLGLPDIYFMITDTLVIFDHVQHIVKVVANARIEGNPGKAYGMAVEKIDRLIRRIKKPVSPDTAELPAVVPDVKIHSNFTKKGFEYIVKKAKSYIRRGDIIQAVLSQRFRTEITCAPFDIYRALRSVNPSPYMYYIDTGESRIIGSSPELLVRCEGNIVETRPIAGTRPRGKDEKDDERLQRQLFSSPKECAEHVMLVDLGRNDIGRVCRSGTVKVTDFMNIEKYSHVMHMVTNVRGRLKRGMDQFDVLSAAFPAGTVSGAPKIRAMQIIDELENISRGPYAGAVGYFGFSGNMDTAITIRTIIVKGNTAYVQAGAGIVADSVPSAEYRETVNKARGMIEAIALAEAF